MVTACGLLLLPGMSSTGGSREVDMLFTRNCGCVPGAGGWGRRRGTGTSTGKLDRSPARRGRWVGKGAGGS